MSTDPCDQVTTAISISDLNCGRYRDVPLALLKQAQQLIWQRAAVSVLFSIPFKYSSPHPIPIAYPSFLDV